MTDASASKLAFTAADPASTSTRATCRSRIRILKEQRVAPRCDLSEEVIAGRVGHRRGCSICLTIGEGDVDAAVGAPSKTMVPLTAPAFGVRTALMPSLLSRSPSETARV